VIPRKDRLIGFASTQRQPSYTWPVPVKGAPACGHSRGLLGLLMVLLDAHRSCLPAWERVGKELHRNASGSLSQNAKNFGGCVMESRGIPHTRIMHMGAHGSCAWSCVTWACYKVTWFMCLTVWSMGMPSLLTHAMGMACDISWA
jgi:hypothetical protein